MPPPVPIFKMANYSFILVPMEMHVLIPNQVILFGKTMKKNFGSCMRTAPEVLPFFGKT
jgi:hypothetical protein